MILFKDGIKRVLEDKDTIEIFKDAGWEEIKEEVAPIIKENKGVEPIKAPAKKTTKKKK